MSRSYREPWYTDGYKGSKRKQFYKNQANRFIRRTNLEIANGKAYRKFSNPWDICDYRFMYDPRLRIRCWGWGEMVVIQPQPYWRVGRK